MTTLRWDGCVNVRDVGGLVRADNIRSLSDDGWRALVDHGVTRVIDLRFPEELAEDPPRDVPVEVVHVSLLGESRTAEWQEEQWQALDGSESVEDYLVWSYLEFLERYRDRFARVFEAIADAPPGPIVVHCVGGKDRTGLVVALSLRLAGRSIDEVAADYALTEANLSERHTEWVDAAADARERWRRAQLLPSPASAMRDVLGELESRYGSVEGYLRAAGVSTEDLALVRERLRAPA